MQNILKFFAICSISSAFAFESINNINIDNINLNNVGVNNNIDIETLSIAKDIAKETLLDRFTYCTNWLLNNLSKYEIAKDYVDFNKLEQDIYIRKEIIKDNKKYKLDDSSWSIIPIYPRECSFKFHKQLRNIIWMPNLYKSYWFFQQKNDRVFLKFNCAYELQNSKSKELDDNELLLYITSLDLDIETSNKLRGGSSPAPVSLLFEYLAEKTTDNDKEIIRLKKYLNDNNKNEILTQFLSYGLMLDTSKTNQYLINYLALDILRNTPKETFIKYNNLIFYDIKKFLITFFMEQLADNDYSIGNNNDYFSIDNSYSIVNSTDYFSSILYGNIDTFVTKFLKSKITLYKDLDDNLKASNNNILYPIYDYNSPQTITTKEYIDDLICDILD